MNPRPPVIRETCARSVSGSMQIGAMNVPLRPNKIQTVTAALILALAVYRRYNAGRKAPAAGEVAGVEPSEQKAPS